MLTIVTSCWAGARPVYSPWHVKNLRNQFARHLTIPHRFVCMTDDIDSMEAAGVDAVRYWKPAVNIKLPSGEERAKWLDCWGRLGLSHPKIGGVLGDWLLSVDLDTVIRSNLDAFVLKAKDAPACFVKMRNMRHLSGFLWSLKPGLLEPCPWHQLHFNPDIFELCDKFVGTDQSVLSYLFLDRVRSGELPSWGEADGVSIDSFKARGWKIFTRSGDRKCWERGMPERVSYLENSADL
jgi:hypothetical protein